MKNFLTFLILLLASCLQGGTVEQREECTQATIDRILPPKQVALKTVATWEQNFPKNLEAAPSRIVHCWYPGTELATSDPSSVPTIISAADLPAGAELASWIDMPGYIVYFTYKEDGSGYDYWAVLNPPKEVER